MIDSIRAIPRQLVPVVPPAAHAIPPVESAAGADGPLSGPVRTAVLRRRRPPVPQAVPPEILPRAPFLAQLLVPLPAMAGPAAARRAYGAGPRGDAPAVNLVA